MATAVIVDALRTPLGRRNGTLKDVHPVDLAAHVLREIVARNDLDPALVEDVIMGCVMQVGEQGINVARNAALAAGFPETTVGTTVDRQCGSSQQAAHFAAQGVMAGAYDIVIAAGVENMTRVPMGASVAEGKFGYPFGPMMTTRYPNLVPQGISAELISEKWGISREANDAFSVQSHLRAAKAREEGRFDREILPIDVKTEAGDVHFAADEGIRRDTTLEKLAALQPSFKPDGVITAGNSSQISDGAAAVLLMTQEKASELGLRPRARIVAQKVVGVDPVMMLTGPIPATRQVLAKAGLALDDIDLFEVNEEFAPVVLAWKRELQPDMERVNVNGGAIALGHPLGCSGTRLMTTLLHELERRGARYGLQTMCCGGGLGTATIIERV